MHRLIEFIKRIYVLVIFLVVEGILLWSYATSTPYTEAKILSRTSAMGAAISGTIYDIGHFFGLAEENRMLTARLAELEQQLGIEEALLKDAGLHGEGLQPYIDGDQHYCYYPARVVSMTTTRKRNYIILDRGMEDGIRQDMGVITPERELVGYVLSCTERYAVVQSILNTDFTTGGRLVESGYVCPIRWSGESNYEVDAVDLSTYAEPRTGMAVEVSSERLPAGIIIGTIESFELNSAQSAYSAKLRIAADMSSLDNLLIVENTHYGEIEELKRTVDGVI